MHHYEIHQENPGFIVPIKHPHLLASPRVLEVGERQGSPCFPASSVFPISPLCCPLEDNWLYERTDWNLGRWGRRTWVPGHQPNIFQLWMGPGHSLDICMESVWGSSWPFLAFWVSCQGCVTNHCAPRNPRPLHSDLWLAGVLSPLPDLFTKESSESSAVILRNSAVTACSTTPAIQPPIASFSVRRGPTSMTDL